MKRDYQKILKEKLEAKGIEYFPVTGGSSGWTLHNYAPGTTNKAIEPLYETIDIMLEDSDPLLTSDIVDALQPIIFTPPAFYERGFYFGKFVLFFA